MLSNKPDSEQTFTITAIQLRELLTSLTVINNGVLENLPPIFGTLLSYRYSAKTGIKLKKLTKLLQTEFPLIEEQRLELCDTHGKKNEKTDNYDIIPEQQEAFDKEIADLWATTIEIPSELKLSIDELRVPLTVKEALELKQTHLDVPLGQLELEKLECLME
jgi:hypothetical protein